MRHSRKAKWKRNKWADGAVDYDTVVGAGSTADYLYNGFMPNHLAAGVPAAALICGKGFWCFGDEVGVVATGLW